MEPTYFQDPTMLKSKLFVRMYQGQVKVESLSQYEFKARVLIESGSLCAQELIRKARASHDWAGLDSDRYAVKILHMLL